MAWRWSGPRDPSRSVRIQRRAPTPVGGRCVNTAVTTLEPDLATTDARRGFAPSRGLPMEAHQSVDAELRRPRAPY